MEECSLVRAPKGEAKRTPIDYQALAVSCNKILGDACFTDATDIAQDLGKSRVRVSRVDL
jgi:hypothetical protein